MLLETTKECIPGWPPGMRSWETSRNTLLHRFWEPTLVLSLNIRHLYIGINANVNLLSILWSTITFFGKVGGVKRLLFHTSPLLQQKHNVKICFSPLHEALHNFLFLKKKCSWKQPRNAFHDDLQERASRRPLGTRSWTGFWNLLWYSPWMLGIYTLESMQM